MSKVALVDQVTDEWCCRVAAEVSSKGTPQDHAATLRHTLELLADPMDPASRTVLAYVNRLRAKLERQVLGVQVPPAAERIDTAAVSLGLGEDELADLYEGWAWRFTPVPSVCAEQD